MSGRHQTFDLVKFTAASLLKVSNDYKLKRPKIDLEDSLVNM